MLQLIMPDPFHHNGKKAAVWGTSLSVYSYSSSDSSSCANIGITQEVLDKEGGKKILGKKQKVETS